MVRINRIVESSYVDGPEERAVVFFQGCPIECVGCQNVALWDAKGGTAYDEQELAVKLAYLAREHGNVTISGGEPFAQVQSLAKLVFYLKKQGVKHVIVYTGYPWETLLNPLTGVLHWIRSILDYVDVIVDGSFEQELDDPYIVYRGSRNQRVIDVDASLCEGKIVTLDWDNPEIVIKADGDLVLPVGLAREMAEIGTVKPSRSCGQTKNC
jgi:anaerobic ribonucleoside-triphosphate reductase activating protein